MIFDHDPTDALPAMDRAFDAIRCGKVEDGEVIAIYDPEKRTRGCRIPGGLRHYLVGTAKHGGQPFLLETRRKLTLGICERVALAICRISPRAGSTKAGPNGVKARAARLTDPSMGGLGIAYIAEGDARGWAPGCVATIFMELRGGSHDCGRPLDYYGDGVEGAARASDLLDGYHIEFINAAVAAVYGD